MTFNFGVHESNVRSMCQQYIFNTLCALFTPISIWKIFISRMLVVQNTATILLPFHFLMHTNKRYDKVFGSIIS
jgi:hypothetical protein